MGDITIFSKVHNVQ